MNNTVLVTSGKVFFNTLLILLFVCRQSLTNEKGLSIYDNIVGIYDVLDSDVDLNFNLCTYFETVLTGEQFLELLDGLEYLRSCSFLTSAAP